MARAAFAIAALAACASPAAPPRRPIVTDAAAPSEPEPELRAIVRIDAQPSGKRFQGVWLERAGDQRWVIDYRAREVWRSFEGEAVLVTGHCYEPHGQAIMATHFAVDRLRLAPGSTKLAPFVEVGPTQRLRGTFVASDAPAGSKLAESSQTVFRSEGGALFWIAVTEPAVSRSPGVSVTITARVVVRSKTYAAAPGGDHLWIVSASDGDGDGEPPVPPRRVPCPK
jgi:hypothetical protein